MQRVTEEQKEFAKRAETFFRLHPEKMTFTDGEIEEGTMFAMYWNDGSIVVFSIGYDPVTRFELGARLPKREVIGAASNCQKEPCQRGRIMQSKKSLNDPEPQPVSREQEPAVWDLVIKDMRERDAIGERKYGTRLQPRNGRAPLRDAYQEALDLAVYLRQEIYERDNREGT